MKKNSYLDHKIEFIMKTFLPCRIYPCTYVFSLLLTHCSGEILLLNFFYINNHNSECVLFNNQSLRSVLMHQGIAFNI